MAACWMSPAWLTLADLGPYPREVAVDGVMWFAVWLNVLAIIPLELVGLALLSSRILKQRLRFGQMLLLAVAANVVTAVLGYPLALSTGFSSYPPVAMVAFYVVSSLVEGGVYMFILRRTVIRFERVWALALVVNLFSYVPGFLLFLT